MSKVIFWVCCFSIASRVIWHIAWRYYFESYLITFFISYYDSFANLSVPNYFSIFSFIPWTNFRISRSASKETARRAFSRAPSVDKSAPVDWNFTCIPVRIVSPKEWIHLSFFPERTAPLILTQSFWFFQARVNLNAPWWESTKVWIAIPVQLFAYFQSVTLQNK